MKFLRLDSKKSLLLRTDSNENRRPAGVVKLVDTLDLGSSAFKSVKVRVLSPAL